jgi:hypothetical protein
LQGVSTTFGDSRFFASRGKIEVTAHLQGQIIPHSAIRQT